MVHGVCSPSQQRRLHRCRPQERNSGHFWAQRNSWLHGTSAVLAPQRHFLETTMRHGGHGGGWQLAVQWWPHGSSLSQYWWQEGVGSVQGIMKAKDQCSHPHSLFFPQKHWRGGWLGHEGQGPSWHANVHVWWPQSSGFPQIRPQE